MVQEKFKQSINFYPGESLTLELNPKFDHELDERNTFIKEISALNPYGHTIATIKVSIRNSLDWPENPQDYVTLFADMRGDDLIIFASIADGTSTLNYKEARDSLSVAQILSGNILSRLRRPGDVTASEINRLILATTDELVRDEKPLEGAAVFQYFYLRNGVVTFSRLGHDDDLGLMVFSDVAKNEVAKISSKLRDNMYLAHPKVSSYDHESIIQDREYFSIEEKRLKKNHLYRIFMGSDGFPSSMEPEEVKILENKWHIEDVVLTNQDPDDQSHVSIEVFN